MDSAIIRVEKLKKDYDGKRVLDIPELEFKTGSIYALVGPNGSGKTTLLKILNLLEASTSGHIYFDGSEINPNSRKALDIRRQMTLVMQSPVLFNTSVYKNVAYGLRVRDYGKEQIRDLIKNSLEQVGLYGFEERKARNLSAGETQRVALARALALEPRLLFMDEPTANVDRRNVKAIESLIHEINTQKGTTVVFTTHDLSQAHRITDKIVSLLDGKIIGSSPENIFFGCCKPGKSGCIIEIKEGIQLKTAENKKGESGIYINPQNISISSKKSPEDQNCFDGKITSVALENEKVRAVVDIGIELVALIKREEFQFRDSDIFEKNIYVSFKDSDVHLF
ncbi:ATP-binding cassette domain-containing protein [Candidatus Poribacteria bacterium]|nr:ATP-binding cassette domain-containing protein [Candidatus Poribacteria bacterium]